MSMTDPKKLLAALAAIPPVALDDFLTETRRKADAERKAEEARRKQAEADAPRVMGCLPNAMRWVPWALSTSSGTPYSAQTDEMPPMSDMQP